MGSKAPAPVLGELFSPCQTTIRLGKETRSPPASTPEITNGKRQVGKVGSKDS